MPEPDTDQYRKSPDMKLGLQDPPYPTKPFLRMTEDEIYLFRRPNEAYNTGGTDGQLPDGLKTDGKNPIHHGGNAIVHEDNG